MTPHRLLRCNRNCLEFRSALTFAASASCSLPGHVKGTGPVIKQALNVEHFHGIVLEGAMDVRLTMSKAFSVEVEGQENIIGLVTTEVTNGIWHIATKEGYSTDKPFVVHIGIPSIRRVSIEGSGDVVGQGEFGTELMELGIAGSGNLTLSFSAETTRAAIEGSGDMRLSGKGGTMDASIAGSGNMDASTLVVIDLKAEIAGSGDITADATGKVNAAIEGSGDIVLMHQPAHIKKRVEGSGDVRVRAR